MTTPLATCALTTFDQPGGDLAGVMLDALQQAPAPMMLTDGHGVIQRVNAAFERISGYNAAELHGRQPSLFKSGLQGESFYRGMWSELRRAGRWQGEIWNRRKDGQVFQECLSIVALRRSHTSAPYYLGMYTGLSSPVQAIARMNGQGDSDATTGLLTRCAFVRALQHLGEQHAVVQVLALDIVGFTELNEQHGLPNGDAILRQLAVRCTRIGAISACGCVVGRVGPDEFALGLVAPAELSAPAVSAGWARRVAARLLEHVSEPFELPDGEKLAVGVTTGHAAMVAGGGNGAEALLHASCARQQAGPGDATLQQYETQDGQRRLAHALSDALRRNRIEVAYQPKVELASGRLAGVEALARWTLEDGTSVPPSEFIPLAERRGLIAKLGECVLEKALAQLARWRDSGLPPPVVAVNFSALQFHCNDPALGVARALERHRLPARLLELELTESLLIGAIDGVMRPLRALRDLGVQLSIDDFGTGYSSLAYLRRFPIQYLKIDRQFVTAMVEDRGACEIVRVIIEMGHRLGLRCIAEGIETTEQLALLRAMGCDEGQGFLLARPMEAQAFTALLQGALPWCGLLGHAEAGCACLPDPDQTGRMPSCPYWTGTSPCPGTSLAAQCDEPPMDIPVHSLSHALAGDDVPFTAAGQPAVPEDTCRTA